MKIFSVHLFYNKKLTEKWQIKIYIFAITTWIFRHKIWCCISRFFICN